ncbi:uncharacterized protein LOC132947783 [Metopolophium dirhodum]|uniref:uncharacterized protein LOC132947783 n=1 Tax=Metopolophium dirhodum TaxID=44670 RepID=UPI00298FCF4E|nr:uncharacterized protein LOC132947783 [Metopolophium dirhodum]
MDNSNERDLVINNAIQQCCDIIFSSLSDDSEDDGNEYEYVVHCLESIETKTAIPRLQNYVETIVPQFNDGQFKANFRMLPTTFEFVLTLIAPKLNRTKPGYKSVSPNKQFLVAIWKMATPDSYRSICEKFDVGRETALRSFITWPSEEKAEEIKNGFFSTSTFPNVLGAIDGTHINIPAPRDHQEAYVNRKGHHSIQLQKQATNPNQEM